VKRLLVLVRKELLPELSVESVSQADPVILKRLPHPWKHLGTGNYAVVVQHPDYPRYAVKVYAPDRPGIEEEVEVYRRLGSHPAFSECYAAGENFLILKRLEGRTLYECLEKGIRIPRQVIRDVDQALDYARARGLHPHDVHAKNVMMNQNGRGLVPDVSDFLKQEYCGMWEDFKRAYNRIYVPIAGRWMFPVPSRVMEAIRKGYRMWRKRVDE
jgi:hypothetical protein